MRASVPRTRSSDRQLAADARKDPLLLLAVVQLLHERFEFLGARESGDPDELRDRIVCEGVRMRVETERSKRVGNWTQPLCRGRVELESERVRGRPRIWQRLGLIRRTPLSDNGGDPSPVVPRPVTEPPPRNVDRQAVEVVGRSEPLVEFLQIDAVLGKER